MRILVVNANTSPSITEMIAAEARRVAAPDVEIEAVTAAFGAPGIETRADVAVAAHATVQAFQDRPTGYDAGIIATFVDPGLRAAREVVDYPVVGIGEAAYLTACTLGARFSVLTVGKTMLTPIAEQVALHGLAGRLAGVHALGVGVVAASRDQAALVAPFKALIERTVEEDGAEVIVLGGAALAGLVPVVAPQVKVPLLDGVACAIGLARSLAALRS
jgi:Asp/Glu/hydantoin racemase